jgi:hypothetical protein
MIQHTQQLDANINIIKSVPDILDVQVSVPEDYITQQTVVECLKFLLIGEHGKMELYVPKELCMHSVVETNDDMIHHWTLPLKKDYVKQYSFETIPRRFIDIEHQNLNQLDGGVPITTLSDNQQHLINDLIAIDGIGSVVLKTIVDPDVKALANCANPIMVCCTPEDVSLGIMYKVIVPEVSHDDSTTFHTIVENLKSIM